MCALSERNIVRPSATTEALCVCGAPAGPPKCCHIEIEFVRDHIWRTRVRCDNQALQITVVARSMMVFWTGVYGYVCVTGQCGV